MNLSRIKTKKDLFELWWKLRKRDGLKLPKSHVEEVLYHLISKDTVSIVDFPYLSGFRARISDIRLLTPVKTVTSRVFTNKYGNSYTYAIHSLIDKEKAIELYRKITE